MENGEEMVDPVADLAIERDLSHEKDPTLWSVGIGILMTLVIIGIFFAAALAVHVPFYYALVCASVIGFNISWVLYWLVLVKKEYLWIEVGGADELVLQRKFGKSKKRISNPNDPRAIPDDLRSVGGPRWHAKGFLEKPFGNPVETAAYSIDIPVQKVKVLGGKFFFVTARVTVKVLVGRYSVLAHPKITTKEAADEKIKGMVKRRIEQGFSLNDGNSIRSNPDEFKRLWLDSLCGGTKVTNDELFGGRQILDTFLTGVNEDKSAEEVTQAQARADAIRNTVSTLLQATPNADETAILAIATNIVDPESSTARVNIISGMPEGASFHLGDSGGPSLPVKKGGKKT